MKNFLSLKLFLVKSTIYIISYTAGSKNWVLQTWRLDFIPRDELHSEGGKNSSQGPKARGMNFFDLKNVIYPEGWNLTAWRLQNPILPDSSVRKHISFTYICALVKFIPWDEFCDSFTQNFREINSSHGYALKNSCHGMNFVILTLRISVKSIKRRFDEIFVGSFRKFSY